MSRLKYIAIFIVLSFGCRAQLPSWEEIEFKEQINLDYCLIDSLGFLWGLSEDGLFKYDGFDFIPALKPKSKDDGFLTFLLDSNNSILIGTELGELIEFNPYKNEIDSKTKVLDSIPISKIYCPDSKSNWTSISYGNGINVQLDGFNQFISEENLLSSNEVYDVLIREKELVIASDQGIHILNILNGKPKVKAFENQNELLDVIISNMISTEDGLWISYFADSLSHFSRDGANHYRFYELGRIKEIKYHGKSLFIASENGLFELNNGDLIQKYPTSGREAVKDFSFDLNGNVWIINGKRKLLRASLLFQKFKTKIPQIQAVQDVDGELWVGNKEGLFRLKDDQLINILDQNITCMSYKHGFVWVGTFSNGLFVLNPKGEIIKNIKKWEGYDNQSVLSLLVIDDALYLSSLTGVIKTSFNINENWLTLGDFKNLNELIGEGYYYQILKHEDQLFFATDGKGILILEKGKLRQIKKFQDGSKIGSVYTMAFDKNGRLWFSSTVNGLGFLEGGKAYVRKQQKNNFDQYSSFNTLENGSLIMIRSGSIDILDPIRNQIIYYENEVGISDEPPFLNSIDISQTKTVFSHNDFVYQYTSPATLKIDPEILINSVLVNLDTLSENSVLSQDQNNIQFNYTGSWLSDPNKLTYRYKLVGFDNDWRETKDRSISYPKLAPGKYNFQLKASINSVFEHEQPEYFRFRITRHFYNTWWFWTIATILLGLLVVKWRDAKRKTFIQQVEIEKKHVETQLSNLKNQLNPHFLFNSFNTLMGLIEEDQERSLSFVEKLTDFYRLVLEQGKNQLIPLEEEMILVRLFSEILNERFDQGLTINLPLIKEHILIPPLTLQLLIENAVKHNQVGGEQKLIVDIFKDGDYLVVRNNLIPKNFQVKSTGSGLNNIKKRYLLLNSKTIQIQKTNDFFEVKLPVIQVNQK